MEMPSRRARLKAKLKELLSSPEWDALDTRLDDGLVRKAVEDPGFKKRKVRCS